MVKIIQPSMAGGEVSPAVSARIDLSKRAVAVQLAENFIPTFTGALRSRPGQQFVARAKPGSDTYRIIEFEFNSTQTFVLELGNQYMRFHALGAQILDSANIKTITGATQADPVVVTSTAHGLSNGDEVYIAGVGGMTQLNGRNFLIANVAANTFELRDLNGTDVDGTSYGAYTSGGTATPPYEIATPWADDDLFDLGYAQSGDVLTICHPDYQPRELRRIDNDTWELELLTFVPDHPEPENIAASTATAPASTGSITGATQANPVVVTSGSHGLTTGDRVYIEGVVGMTELNNFLYTVTVLSANTFELAYIDGVDVDGTGFTAYSSGGTWFEAPRPRTYAITAVNADDEEESLRGLSSRSITITGITQADPAVVTTSEGHGLNNLDEIEISGAVGMTELNGERFEIINIDATSFSLKRLDGSDVDSTGFTAYASGGVAKPMFFTVFTSADTEWDNVISWDVVANTQNYNIYATDNFGVFGFVGATTKNVFDDKNIEPDYSVTPPRLFNPFDTFIDGGVNLQPSTVGYFQQRRVFANSNRFPNRFWMSQIGHFSNLSRAIPPLDDDSIVASIAARRINEIRHILPLSDLAMLTSGGEYRVFAQEGVITPTTVNLRPQSYYGSTKVRPIVAGEAGLFVTPGQFIRDLKYQFAEDKLVGRDLTVLARHLFRYNTIIDWDFAPAPDAIAFIVRNDGMGLFLTYMPEQEVQAFSRATTRGKYLSTCVVAENERDVVYMAVRRVINGNTVVFIERQADGDYESVQDAFCVDAGLTLDAPITITGMTAADPVVVTAPSHGLSNGDTVDISGVFEVADTNTGEQLSADYNGLTFTVANVTTNTFELQNAGSDYDGSAFAAYSSGGVVRKAVTTVSGLWHLEGAAVVAAANGYSVKGLTVTNGSITLPTPASRIHVGLPYTPRLLTLPLASYANSGETVRSKLMNINRLSVEVERTMGLWFGPDFDSMREAKFGLPARWGQELPMVTELINVTMKGDWSRDKQIAIEQRDPLPLTILGLIPDVAVGGN